MNRTVKTSFEAIVAHCVRGLGVELSVQDWGLSKHVLGAGEVGGGAG
jgi:hypothetical protein